MIQSSDIKIFPIFRGLSDSVAAIGQIKYNLNPEKYDSMDDACEQALVNYTEGLANRPVLFGAYYNSHLLGFASAGNISNPDTEMYLKELYVRKEYQYPFLREAGRSALNIGSKLLCGVEETLSLYGNVLTLESTICGAKLYERRGYVNDGGWSPMGNTYIKALSGPNDGVYPLFELNGAMFDDLCNVLSCVYKDDRARDQACNVRDAIDEYKWPTFGYFLDGRLVGFLQANKISKVPHMKLNKRFVATKYQHQGIGRALMTEFLDYVEVNGILRVETTLMYDPNDKGYARKMRMDREKYGFRPMKFDDYKMERFTPWRHGAAR